MDGRVYDALAQARAFGFLGPGPVEAHVANGHAFASAIGELTGRALDLGSGGGVPGLVLAGLFEHAEWILLDGSRRRTAFLSDHVARLGWGARVQVVRARAEEAGHDPALRGTCQVVTARSFGPPALTAECGAAFLEPGGRLLVAEPPAEHEDRWQGSRRAGVQLVAVQGEEGARIAVLERTADPLPELPRSTRKLRHPLF